MRKWCILHLTSFQKTIKIGELVLERALRLVEDGRDVIILMDSLTRLARAHYNLTTFRKNIEWWD